MARNTKNPVDSASFQALLNRHAALENIEAVMTIYGNPQLLGEMLMVPSDLPNGQTESPKFGETINPRWLSTPTLVKVNIKMPVDANDVNTEYEDFWYTGYYTIFAVKQVFEDGEFTQELDMMSLPVGDEIEKKTDEKKDTEAEKKKWSGTTDTAPTTQPDVADDDDHADYTGDETVPADETADETDGDKMTIAQRKAKSFTQRKETT